MNRRTVFGLCAGAFVLCQLALTNHFLSFRSVLSTAPLWGDDFDTHIAQTFRVVEGLERFGRSWVYDVKLLAGQPAGVIFDADNKGWELWTYALHQLGAPLGAAFNTYVLLAHLGCPLLLFASARLLGIGPFASLLSALLATLLWYFDSFLHWMWWVGMVAYASSACFALLPLACFHRFVHGRRTRGATGWALATAVTLALAHLNHPYSFFILAPPMAVLVFQHAREMSRRDRLLVAAIVVVTLAANGYWLHTAAMHWHYILDSAYFGQTGLGYLVADFFGVLLNPSDSGVIGTRAGMRFLCLALALPALVQWRRTGDPRFWPFAVTIGWLFCLAYLGGYIPAIRQFQPYRHIAPLAFVCALLAGAFAEQLVAAGTLQGLGRHARLLLSAVTLLAIQGLGREALYFLPELVPAVPPLIDGSTSPVSAHGYGRLHPTLAHPAYRLPRPQFFEHGSPEVHAWLTQHTAPGERILVDHAAFGERLAWSSQLEVLGGFRERNLAHAYANFFRSFPHPATPAQVETYLRTFAVRWVLLHKPRADLERAPSLELVTELHGRKIYRNRAPVSQVLRGGGRAVASTNRIEVRGANPDEDLIVAYHYHEALGCVPDCRVVRHSVPIDRVGFIRVPAPHPRDLEIRNTYVPVGPNVNIP